MNYFEEISRAVCGRLGLQYVNHEIVPGGDINQAAKIITSDSAYFLKVNSASLYPAMFKREAEGLFALSGESSMKVPRVIGCGEEANWQWLVLEWLEKEKSSTGFWRQFGYGLASLHRNTNNEYG